jgi:hypothetical protein
VKLWFNEELLPGVDGMGGGHETEALPLGAVGIGGSQDTLDELLPAGVGGVPKLTLTED